MRHSSFLHEVCTTFKNKETLCRTASKGLVVSRLSDYQLTRSWCHFSDISCIIVLTWIGCLPLVLNYR